jgi:hypothetical protein
MVWKCFCIMGYWAETAPSASNSKLVKRQDAVKFIESKGWLVKDHITFKGCFFYLLDQ